MEKHTAFLGNSSSPYVSNDTPIVKEGQTNEFDFLDVFEKSSMLACGRSFA